MGAFVWIALPLMVLAVLLFAWGLEPKRTETFVGRLPYTNYLPHWLNYPRPEQGNFF
jgi:hypothetical protein